jgi:flagellar biogenesis protein FliO
MHLIARTIGLILLATYPAGLSAQTVPYQSASATANDVAPAAYQQPVSGQENPNPNAQPQRAVAADKAPWAGAASPLPLRPHTPADRTETSHRPEGLQSIATVGGSLAAVLGVFFLIVWLLRRASPRGLGILPGEAFEVLGRAPLANSQQVHLIRCGNKLLLVAVAAAGAGASATTLTEITDPEEVDRMADLCRQGRTSDTAATFRRAFRQAEVRHV